MKRARRDEPPTTEQARAFQAMYDYFNRVLFRNELAPVFLNFSRHKGALGFFAPERWQGVGPGARHEISLNPSYLATREPREVASTLVHEMVHAWQQEYGTPGRRGYHNHEWATKMEEVGLMPSTTAAPGGDRVGQSVSHYVIESGPFARAFEKMPKAAWLPWTCRELSPAEKIRKKKSAASKTKYTCGGGCGTNVWGKPGLAVMCTDCDELFVESC